MGQLIRFVRRLLGGNLLAEGRINQRDDGFANVGLKMGPSLGDVLKRWREFDVTRRRAQTLCAADALPSTPSEVPSFS